MFMFIRILIILLLYCLPLKADQYDVRLEQLFNLLLEIDKEEEINKSRQDRQSASKDPLCLHLQD